MLKYAKHWLLIALFLFLATLGYTVRAKDALQPPCRPSLPQLCHPDTQPPLCQPLICPDAD